MQDKNPLPLPQLFAKALQLHRAGQLTSAQEIYEQALSVDPQHFDALHLSGVLAAQLGDYPRADHLLARAVAVKPDPIACNNHGNVLKDLGRFDAAVASYDRALALRPDYAECHFNRAVALHELHRFDDAVAGYDRAIALKADHAEAHHNRGLALSMLGRLEAALGSHDRAVALKPGYVQAHFSRALALQQLGRLDDAVAGYDKAIALRPAYAEAHANRGAALQKLQKLEAAVAGFERALEIDPGDAEVHYNRGVALQELAQPGAARESYLEALRLKPDFAMARWALAFLALPPLFALGQDPEASRQTFGKALDDLDAWFVPSTMAGAHQAVATRRPFYLSYQEADNRPLLSRYGALCHRLMHHWQQANAIRPARPSSSGKIRVGIVSSNICSHSVWTAIVKGIILNLDPARFEVHVFYLGTVSDRETALAQSQATSFAFGERSLICWTEAILQQRPEVLIYPEVGMHALTSQLATLRLAPVQAAMWGHPETTGLPTIDYYLSGRDLEPEGAESHYTEQLVRLPNLGCHYARQSDPSAAPQIESPDLLRDRPLLLCPGTTFKYMPRHDWVYAQIARRLGKCRLVFFSQQPQWTSLLKQRLRAAFEDRDLELDAHVSFIPWLAKPQFIGLMRQADVFLDTIGFSGFNTAMQAVECGLPIVTRQGRFMRGRLAGAILARMGMSELIAETDEDYVGLAARLASDAQYRQRIREQMRDRQQVLFDDLEPIRALEQFLVGVCRTSPQDQARQASAST